MGLFDTFLSGDSGQNGQSPLDQLFSVTPQMRQQAANQGMLQMAAGLLQAGGPSRMPVNFGQALGYGMQQGLSGYNNTLDTRMKQQALAGELAKDKLGVMQGLASQVAQARAFGQPVPPYISQMLGGQTTTTGQAATTPNTPANSAFTPTPGTWSAAPSPIGNAGFAPAPGLGSADMSAAASTPDAGQPLLRLPQGMNGAQAYAMSLNSATAPIIQKAIENQYPGPTQLEQMLIAKGVKPGSDEWNATMSAGIFHDTYVKPETGRPGGYFRDPQTGKLTWLPNVPQGGMPQFDAQGNFTGVKPIPGAANVTATQSTAQASGQAKFKFEKVFDPATNTYVYRSTADMGNNGDAAGGAPATKGPFAGYKPPVAGSMQAGPALGASAASDEFAKGNAKDAIALQQLAADSPNRKATLQGMSDYLGDFNSGKGANAINTFKSYANTWLPNGFGFDPKKMSAQEIFTKGATQVLAQQFKALGSAGADNSLQTLKSGFPNAEMQNLANRYLLHTMEGNEDAITVRNNEMQKWIAQNGPQSVGAFNATFNQHFDPRVFSSQYMSKDELTHMVEHMTPAQARDFQSKRAFAKQHGWLQ